MLEQAVLSWGENMNNLHKFKGFEYEKLTNYQEITNHLLDTNCDVHELGLSSNGDMVYGLSVGDLSKPMIFVDGTMHGSHEWRCTHWVKEFIERIKTPVMDANKPIIEELKSKFCFMAVPCLNTYGYLFDSYNNANNVNLNRNFLEGWESYPDQPGTSQAKGSAPFSEPESQIIKYIYDTYRVIGHVNCHTWGGNQGAIFETSATSRPVRMLLREMSKVVQFVIPECDLVFRTTNSTTIPWVNEWGCTQDSKTGRNTVSTIFEVGSEETEYDQAEFGMTGLFVFSYYLSEWYTKSKIIL